MNIALYKEDGDVVNAKRPKHNSGIEDLDNTLVALWTQDVTAFIPERHRVQATLLFHILCYTGARIGAFFPGKDKDGLRWRVCTPAFWLTQLSDRLLGFRACPYAIDITCSSLKIRTALRALLLPFNEK